MRQLKSMHDDRAYRVQFIGVFFGRFGFGPSLCQWA